MLNSQIKAETQERACSLCKLTKPISHFGNHKTGKDGLRSRCKPCNKLEANKTYAKNPDPYKKRARVFRKASATNAKAWLNTIKKKYGCHVCSEREVCVLDFHHLGNKDLSVTTAISKGIEKNGGGAC